MTPHEYLQTQLDNNKLSEEEQNNVSERKQKIEDKLRGEFGSKIQSIKYSGSISKGTAVKNSHDIDIALHFKNDSFSTLKEMYDSVYDFLEKHYKVRKQKVSIGLPGQDVDVVPGRRINPDDSSDNDVFLYRTDNDSRIKTNIEKQKDAIRESGSKEVIKLCKIWRDNWNLEFKSFALELLVIKALEDFDGKGYDNKFRHLLEYICENVESVTLTDPGNSNNDVAETVESSKKKLFKSTAKECIKFIDDAEQSEEDKDDNILNAWKKVFNETTNNESKGSATFNRFVIPTQDYRAQSNRHHG